MSLNEAATLFGLSQSKLKINHDEIEEAYLRGTLDVCIYKYARDIELYARRDVELLKQITEGIIRIYAESGINYERHLTRSMASISMWKDTMGDETRKMLQTVEFGYHDSIIFTHGMVNIEDIKEHAIGGRVQALQGEYDHVTLLDFKSMYPGVATTELYPCGEYHATEEYIPNRLGLYIVEVSRQSYPHVVPHRLSKHKSYNWSYEGTITKILTNIDVECLMESGAEFKITDGIVWENSTNYFADHMMGLFQLRMDAKSKDNIVLSEHYKHMANSLTGAIFQQLRREYAKVFVNRHEVDVYMKMHNRYIQMTHELIYPNGQIILYFIPKKLEGNHNIKMQSQICKGAMSSKPIILTMFIYAYSRAKLWRTWRHIENNKLGTVTYCDTDSLAVVARCVDRNRYINITASLKEYIGSEMGQLEVVMTNARMSVISPKVYAMRDRSGMERVRVRNVSARDVLYLLPPGSEREIATLRDGGWYQARSLHLSPYEKLRVSLCYDNISSLLKGNTILVVHWYFTRVDGQVQKRYTTMVLRT
jgi:hypothetical protein